MKVRVFLFGSAAIKSYEILLSYADGDFFPFEILNELIRTEEASNDDLLERHVGQLMQVDQVSQVIQAKLTAQSLQSPEATE